MPAVTSLLLSDFLEPACGFARLLHTVPAVTTDGPLERAMSKYAAGDDAALGTVYESS